MIAWAKSRRVLASLVATILLTWVAVSAAQVMITVPNLRSPGTFAHALGLFVALLSGSITAYQLNGRTPLESSSVRPTDALDAGLVLASLLTAAAVAHLLGINDHTSNVMRNIVASSTMVLLLLPLTGAKVAALAPPSWGVLASLVGISHRGVDPWALPISQTTLSGAALALTALTAGALHIFLTRNQPLLARWTSRLRP